MPTASGTQHYIDSINSAAAHETIDLHMVVRNREALQRLDRSIRRRSQENPFGPHIILVDSLSIGRNVLSGLAEFGGMAVGVETVRIPTFLQRVAQAVHRFDGKDPASLPPQLSHQALALAIIAAIPQLTARHADKCVKEIASNIKNAATLSSQLSLASEWARSFDYALRQAADLSAPTVAPWVGHLHAALLAYAASNTSIADNKRLANYLNQHQDTDAILERLEQDQDLRITLSRQKVLPNTLYAFDLTLLKGSPSARSIELLAKIVNLEFFLISPDGSTVRSQHSDAVVRAWVDRSTVPLRSTTETLQTVEGFSENTLEASDDLSPESPSTPLHGIQQAVAGGSSPQIPAGQQDHSLAIYHVSNATRSADITRDALHQAFDELENLLPEQIAVVTDEPRKNSPSLTVAFGSPNKGENLPATLTGANTRDWHSVIDAFLTAIALAPTSFKLDAVFRLVFLPPVLRGLGLEPVDASDLRTACENAGLRSYIDADHREDVTALPGQHDYCTWVAAFRSLAASMAVPGGGNLVATYGEISPAGNLQATQMPLLRALQKVIQALRALRELTGDSLLTEKIQTTRELTALLFGSGIRAKASCEAIYSALDSIAADADATGFTSDVDFIWFKGELSRRLNRNDTRTRALHGGISVLRPSQARCRTPRVTILLLSEKFPQNDRPFWPEPFAKPDAFPTQTAQDLRDILSCFTNTTDRVVCVVTSLCDRTGERLLMSSVIHDIKAVAESLGISITEEVTSVTPHSLMAATGNLLTRHRGCRDGAKALSHAVTCGPQPQIFAIPDPQYNVPHEVTLRSFIDFFRNPLKEFLRHRRIYVKDIESSPQIREPLDSSNDYLRRYTVRKAIFDAFEEAKRALPLGKMRDLTDEEKSNLICRLRSNGDLRQDVAGSIFFHEQYDDVETMQNDWTAGSCDRIPIDETVSYQLHGNTYQLRIYGECFKNSTEFTTYTLGSVKEKDHVGLAVLESVLWQSPMLLATFALNHSTTPNLCSIPSSAPLPEDFTKRDDPHRNIPLDSLARLWHLGMQMPLPLFPGTIRAALPDAGPASNANPCNLAKACEVFNKPNRGFGAGEGREKEVALLFRGQANPLNHNACSNHGGSTAESDFERLAYFFSRGISDPYSMF